MKTALAIPLVILIFILGNLFLDYNVVVDTVDKTFDNVSELHVTGSFASINIVGDSRNNIELKGELSASRDRDDISIEYELRGDALYVWIERPRSLSKVSGNLTFLVPEKTVLVVDNSSGSVSVSNLETGQAKIKSSSGSIKVDGIVGDLNISASSGSLKLNDIVGQISGLTSSGSINVNQIVGDLNLKSSSGGQSINNLKGSVNCKASSGSLKLNGVKGDIKAVTSSGSIRLEDVKGSLNLISSSGSQNGNNILLSANSSFTSSSGSISMNLKNDMEDLTFDLSASSGSLRAKGSSGSKNLKGGSGPIYVKGSSVSGSQKYN